MSSAAYQIITAMQARLATMTTGNGYNYNMGSNLYLGKQQINETQLDSGPQVQLYLTDDIPQDSDRHVDPMMIELGMVVIGASFTGSTNPLLMASNMLEDIKSAALVVGGETLGGKTLDVGYAGSVIEYPDAGGDAVVVTCNFTTLYEETYGTP